MREDQARIERLKLETQHERDRGQQEREMRQIRLENALLRIERGIPPRQAGTLDVE